MKRLLLSGLGLSASVLFLSGCPIVDYGCDFDSDCGSGYECRGGECVPIGTADCRDGTGVCDAGYYCDFFDGLCHLEDVCTSDLDCDASSYCGTDGQCYILGDCTTGGICPDGYSCWGGDGNCYLNDTCTSDLDCGANYYCGWTDGLCWPLLAGDGCLTNSECNLDGTGSWYCGWDGNCYQDTTTGACYEVGSECPAGFYCSWDGFCYEDLATGCLSDGDCGGLACGRDGNCYADGCEAAGCPAGSLCEADGICYF